MNWYESYAFCIWDGGFLPSDAEWAYVAAGGGGVDGQLEYPWGSASPGAGTEYAIYECNYGPSHCTGNDGSNLAPVGTAALGAARWGQLDMEGELMEWIFDGSGTFAACTDCALLAATSFGRVVRGNHFFGYAINLQSSDDDSSGTPDQRVYFYGFRCARAP